MLRFAILKTVNDRSGVVLEYNEQQVLERLKSLLRENLLDGTQNNKKRFSSSMIPDEKRVWNIDTITHAMNKSFNDLVNEIKAKTLRIG